METLRSIFLPPQKSTIAPDIDMLFNFIHLISLLIFVGLILVTAYFIYKYKRKSADDITSLNDHNNALEIAWSIIPVLLIVFVFAWGFRDFIRLSTPPDDAYEIHVKAWKWNWEFKYANGNAIDELIVPVNRPIKLIMSSEDVLHSFYVPDFRVKHDVIPGRYTSVWFEATEVGESYIFCTEYCGTQHSNMIKIVKVVDEDEFEEFLKQGGGRPEDVPLADWGKKLYVSKGCQACHSVDGKVLVGPSFKGLYGADRQFTSGPSMKADENYIRESIVQPGAKIVAGFGNVMPSFADLSDDDLASLIEYIKEQK